MVRRVDCQFGDGREGIRVNLCHDVPGRRPVDQRLVGDLFLEPDIQPIGIIVARCGSPDLAFRPLREMRQKTFLRLFDPFLA